MHKPKLTIDSGKFRLLEDYKYIFWNGDYVIVPKGYRTNFASIPRIARGFISQTDPDLLIASIVHDWVIGEFPAYGKRRVIYHGDRVVDDRIGRLQAASIMQKVMRETGCPLWKQQVVYGSLRLYEASRGIALLALSALRALVRDGGTD